jgi:hypothetical protein
MLLAQDTIASQQFDIGIQTDSAAHIPARPQTPYQVLRMLPKDATPAQQDSAIQAWFQPGEIHYSSRPDTLHLPGHDAGRSLKDVNLPQYYRESFFTQDTLLHPELSGGRMGMAGDPIPYLVRNDDAITGMLLFCFVMALTAFAHSRHFILRQLKDFFYVPRAESPNSEDPSNRFQMFLCLQTCLLLAITSYFYVDHYITNTFVLDSPYEFICIFFGAFVGYFLVKNAVYWMVNSVFFDGKKSKHWIWTLTFITALEGVALYPIVILQVYFSLPMQNVVYCLVFILILTKILTFYKCWAIFFRQISFFLQIFLYFCALEIVPLLALVSILVLITDVLKVNF